MKRGLPALMLILAACAQEALPQTFPVVASSDLAVGQDRMLVALYDDRNASVASAELPASFDLLPPGDAPSISVPARFIWTIPNEWGIYGATVQLDRPGGWAVVVHQEGRQPTDPAPFTVREEPATVAMGETAPRSETPTSPPAELGEITTDPDPDPRFYRLSVGEAIASGRPTVIVFATPAFCTSQVCGPTLELVAEQVDLYPEVNFVHVEVYDLAQTPEELIPVPAVEEWGLPSEPWVFVVNPDGVVSARFEGTVTSEELATALER